MVRGLVVLLVLAGACEKQEHRTTPSAPAAHHPEAEKVFEACLASPEACSQIYSVAGCREAHERMAENPPESAADTLLTSCAKAYCPLLPAPRPAACDRIPDGHADRLAYWITLQQAISIFELGEVRARTLAEASRSTITVAVDLPPTNPPLPANPGPKLVVSITRDGHVIVGSRPTTDVLQALTEARKNGHDAIYIQADQHATYAIVVQVMSAAKQAGIEKVQLITDDDMKPSVPAPRKPPR